MAVGRKSRENLDVVLVNDPAVLRDSEEAAKALAEYVRTRDPKVLVLADHAKPTRFVIRALSHEAFGACEAETDPHLRAELAFRLALERIENLAGEPMPITHETLAALEDWKALTSKCAKQIAEELGELVVREVGIVAYQRAGMTANQKKAFSLGRGCAVDWEASTPAIAPIIPTTESGS